jgi:glycogen debranching enzyme
MAEPWTYAGEVARLGAPDGSVTLVEGASFSLSGGNGDLRPGGADGMFLLDTRFLSRLELRVDGAPMEALGVSLEEPFSATFFGRCVPLAGAADSALVVFRTRHVGNGLLEHIELRNYAPEPRSVVVEIELDVDFADLFDVKEGRTSPRGRRKLELGESSLRFGSELEGRTKVAAVTFDRPLPRGGLPRWEVELAPKETWSLRFDVVASIEGVEVAPRYRLGTPVDSASPARQLSAWRSTVPVVATDHTALATAVYRAAEDLGALRIFDPDHPERAVVAAGAPWFMTLFGRDSLLTAYMALLVDPELARGVLETLARFQGTKVDPATEEEPGRILHEMRFGGASSSSLAGGTVYYGTVDATPLFVLLLGELRRWGLETDAVDALLPHADRALEWVETYGDRDGDGYVEYERATPRGLANQGWKDSWDGIRYLDGRVPEGPIALCEVQGYVYAAYLARAYFAEERGDDGAVDRWRSKAAALKEAFNRDFWLPEHGWFAMGLDGDKRPIDALASNMGHCLWTGLVDEDKAASVAGHLLSPEMFSGWGVRTMATSMAAYNPVSYHCGSVWPHDNAILAAGLVRYGFVDEATRIIEGLLAAAAAGGGRLPELFSGLGRDELSVPAAYPTSCVPQAWAAAAPLLFLRTLLRLDPWVPHGRVWLAPALPPSVQRLRVDRIPIGSDRMSVEVVAGAVRVEGLGPDVELVQSPRRPLTAALPARR